MQYTDHINNIKKKHSGSIFRMSCYLHIKVCEVSTGEVLGAGARGEIWVRGPTVMKGVSPQLKRVRAHSL